jgi:amino acid transporter
MRATLVLSMSTEPLAPAEEAHGLKRELRLPDLVLLQVLLIVGLTWIGNAAVQGSTHVLLWLAGILLFYVPLGMVVIHLSRAIPAEGGAYQWVKAGISPFAGYMTAWNTSFYTVFTYGTIGPTLINSIAYIAGPRGAWMMDSIPLILAIGIFALLAVFAVNVLGFRLGKWLTGGGSLLTVALSLLLLYLLVAPRTHGSPPAHAPFSLAMPALTILTLNVFTKMSLGALSGFESASVFAGECRNPDRDLPLSVMIAAPSIAAIYILGTGAMLAYVPPDKVDLAAPLQQLVHAGFGDTGLGGVLTTVAVLALLMNSVTGAIAMVGLAARFPMVIGWDGLLPDWSSRLHPRHRTPVHSLAAVTAACIFVAIVSSLGGAGGQEIFQVGTSAAVGCLCVEYGLIFAVPLFARPSLAGQKPALRGGKLLRLAAASGFAVSLLSLPFQIVPLTGVPNRGLFALKVIVLILAINVAGGWLYRSGLQRLRARDLAGQIVGGSSGR